MADTINKIKWVITDVGLNKILYAKQHPEESIFLPYIKFGDANGTYYVPSESATDLIHPVHTSMVNKKSRSTADVNTVIFSTEVNEDQGGFTVREIGLYGVDNNAESEEDREFLFAIGTCEPFYKPSIDDDYVIYLTFDVCIKYADLMVIYDKIKIDEASEYATKEDLDNVVKDMLYIEGNLMEQINDNTKINGLSRVSQLYEFINESVKVYNSIFSNFNYTALLSQVDINKIMGYWVFNYSGTSSIWRYLPDIGNKGNFLNLSGTTSSFNRGYTGLAPYFNITNNKFYEIDVSKVDNYTIIGSPTITSDWIASGFNSNSYVKPNTSFNSTLAVEYIFRDVKLSSPTISSNYNLLFGSSNNTYAKIGWHKNNRYLGLYDGSQWVFNDNAFHLDLDVYYDFKLTWDGAQYSLYGKQSNTSEWTLAAQIDKDTNILNSNLWIGRNSTNTSEYFDGSIDLRQFSIMTNGSTIFNGNQITVNTDNNIDFCIKNNDYPSGKDLPFSIFICLSSNTNNSSVYLAKFNEQLNKRAFHIGKNSENGATVTLYTDATHWVTFSTSNNIVKPNEFMVLGFRYNGDRMNPKVDIFVNGKNVGTTKTTNGQNNPYTGMNYDDSKVLKLTSYLINSSGNKFDYADAKIAQEVIISDYINDSSMKAISYNLMAIMGLNVCYRISST